MAERFHAAMNHSYNTEQYSAPTAILLNGPPLLSNSQVKQETSCMSHNRVGGNKRTSRPSKRQKTGEEEARNGHKFVSQKKWKFSDAQPWLPSRTSSKAQNASKASIKYQHRSASPKRSTSPRKTSAFRESDGASISIKSGGFQLAQQNIDNQVYAPQTAPACEPRSKGENHRDIQKPRPAQVQESIEVLPVIRRSSSHHDDAPRKRGHLRRLSGELETMESSSESRAASDTPKPSRLPQALSLEKDAARIAALIAEKRKENESSMFRERMLRRQFEHRTHRDNGKSSATLSTITTDIQPSELRICSSPLSDGEGLNSPVDDLPSTPASTSSPEISNSSSMINENDVTHTEIRVQKATIQRNDSVMARSSRSEMNERRTKTASSSTDKPFASDATNQISTSSGSPNNANGEQWSTTGANRFENITFPNRQSSFLETQGRNAPFEVEDADVAAQYIAFTSQFLQSKPIPKKRPSMDNLSRRSQSMFYQRQLSNSSPPVQSTTVESSKTTDRNHFSTNSGPQSAISSSSRLLHKESIPQHFRPDILPSQHSPTGYTVRPVSAANVHNNNLQFQPIAYRTINQQVFIPSDRQHLHPDSVSHAAHSAAVPQQIMANTAGTSMLLQQHLPQPPVLASNVNMFSGEARSNGSNGMGPPAPKPRVNMFGNTKGSPFTMHEVIRQIEMT